MEFGIKNIIFLLLFTAAGAFFTVNVMKLISYLKLAKPDNRFDNVGERISRTIKIAIFQSKILRDKQAGPIHAGIFWGFLILLFSVINSIFTGFGIHEIFNYLGPIFSAITILTDIFAIMIIAGVAASLYRRYVKKVARLQREGHTLEAGLILMTIFTIVTSLLFENASLIAMSGDATWAVRPVSAILALIIPSGTASIIYEIAWWLHIMLIFGFMNFLPYSKHLHVLTSVINVYFSNLTPNNKLQRIDFEDESIEQYGVTDIEHFSWKTLLDGYTCTECGRCTSVCPANQTGKILDPREIIVQIRKRTMDKAPIMIKMQKEAELAKSENREPVELVLTEEEQTIMNKKLIGDYVNPEALWQCTSCSACMEECPVTIEHVPAIIEMRRSLVMMDSEFPSELQLAFGNIENNAAPWAFSQDSRADWAEGMDVPIAAEANEFDILYWVGCAGSFDDRAKKITQSFAELMQIAGVKFAILGPEESCTGDPARRAGNEYLADMYVKMNVETMNNYNVKKIVATCPHCFNTLKNEYSQFGGNYEVVHHTQFISDLVKEGKIPLSESAHEAASVVYHDSCYLGRLNDVYEQPRNILTGIKGLNVINPKRSKDRGFCCGAGGAQMFLEENQGKRVNIERTEELLATGAKTIALNCPFCMTMISDGVKAKEVEGIQVKDISEIVLESIKAKV